MGVAIVVTRVKDRFLQAPSAGGWRDCMVNFYVRDDPHRHICEIQLVHHQMLFARKGLPGHDVYNRVRNADEIMRAMWVLQPEQPQRKAELQEWLLAWQQGEGTHGPPNLWDVSKITDMAELFKMDVLRRFNADISAWDTSNVVNMKEMFHGCASFNQPLGAWDTGNVSNMVGMFSDATSYNQPLSTWNTSNVSDMFDMFSGAPAMSSSNYPPVGRPPPQSLEVLLVWLEKWEPQGA
jgi:surface protein